MKDENSADSMRRCAWADHEIRGCSVGRRKEIRRRSAPFHPFSFVFTLFGGFLPPCASVMQLCLGRSLLMLRCS